MNVSKTMLSLSILGITVISCSKEKNAPAPVVAPSTKVVAVMKFDGNLNDSAGKIFLNGINGTTSYTTDHKGNPNGALNLDGASKLEYLDVPFKGQSVTMAVWVKFPNVSQGTQNFISAMHPVTGGITLFQTLLKLGATVSVTGTDNAVSNTLDNAWHHLAMTFDGKDIKVYIDGGLSATTSNPGTIGDGKRSLVIGGFSNYFWTGAIDDLRIYDTAFTQNQIQQLLDL